MWYPSRSPYVSTAGLDSHQARRERRSVCRLWSNCDERDKSPDVASWLQAAFRRIVNYVGFTSSSGSSDAEFPLLEVLRTKPGVPRPAAFDPKATYGALQNVRAAGAGSATEREGSVKLEHEALFKERVKGFAKKLKHDADQVKEANEAGQ